MMLRNYAKYLSENHLEALSTEYVRLARELQLPLLQFFAHLSEQEIRQMGINNMGELLADLASSRALEAEEERLRAWMEDRMPFGITKAGLQPGDHVLVFAAQKMAIAGFIDQFTDSVAVAKAVTRELDEYFYKVQYGAVRLFAKLRDEAVEHIRRVNVEIGTEKAFVENIVKHVPAGIIYVDNHFVVRWANRELARLFDRAPQDIIDRPCLECVPTPLRATFESLLRKAFVSGEVLTCLEYPAVATVDGMSKATYWEIIFVPVYDQGGIIEGVLVFSQDVSDRVALGVVQRDQIERLELLNTIRDSFDEQRRMFDLFIESAAEYAINVLDAEGVVKSWNKGAERIRGYEQAEAMGMPFARFFLPDDVQQGKPGRLLTRAAANGHVEDEGWRLRKDGTHFWADVVITALRDVSCQLKGFVVVARDVTERKLAEEKILKLNMSLVSANEYKDQFLNILSHELRTPITSIIGFGSLLDDELVGPLNEEQHDCTVKLMAAAETLSLLMNDLLDVSRLQAGKVVLTFRLIDVAPITEDVLANLAHTAERHLVTLRNRVSADLPPIEADEQRLAQILTTLIGNAVKFTQPGGWVEVRAKDEGRFILCEVEDNGPGIRLEEQGKLFKTFSQVDMTNTRESSGIGMGLTICKSLVELHGGEIGVGTSEGKGCTFWFKLPFVQGGLSPAA
ncbi:MAG: hypothetical protein JWM80_2787 [Cyanobacteria bacterium RYN_339]|nr:hypothetical protein [Cyanobacteria bacterium RYN_339]